MGAGVLAFVGRETELDELRAGIDEAIAGRGGLWLLAGEPGIGKSRLAEELAREAQGRGVTALWGRCWESGGAPAFWPWLQVMRGALRLRDDALPEDRARILAQLLPELDRGDEAPQLSGEQARFQLLDAIAATLCEQAAAGPLLIVLEDLHIADAASLSLLEFLGQQVRSAGVMLLGTSREAHGGAAESTALLVRIAQEARTVPLPRLTADEIGAFLDRATGSAPAPDLVETVHRRTEGNPLFVVELARLFIAHGGLDPERARAVPPTIRTAVQQRLAALPDDARGILELAAVVGRDFLAGRLAEAFERSASQVRTALDAAEESALILGVGPGAYRFSHILIREALYLAVVDDRRAELHLALGRHLRSRHAHDADGPWSEIAHHLFAAGPAARDDAIDAAIRAGDCAARILAFEDAVRDYRRALDAGGPNDPRRGRILCAMGRALIRTGDLAGGRALCREAADSARDRGDAEALAAAALAYGSELVFAEVDPTLIRMLDEALALLPEVDSPLRVKLLARLAAAEQPAADPTGPIARARAAIEMARRLGDRRALVDALRTGCSAMMDLERPDIRAPFNREHATLAAELGDRADAFRGRHRSVIDCLELGDRAGAERELDAMRALADELDHDYYRWRLCAIDACMALWEGRFADAESLIEQASALGRRIGDANVDKAILYQRIRLYRLAGRADELIPLVGEMTRLFDGTAAAPTAQVVGMAQLLALGRKEEAMRQYRQLAGDDELFTCADRTLFENVAELALAAGDRVMARQLLDHLGDCGDQLVTSGVLGMTWDSPLHRAVALAHRTVGDDDAAIAAYQRGIDLCRALGGEPMVAWQCEEAAATALDRNGDGDRERARAWAAEAASIAERLGMAPVLRRARATLARIDDEPAATGPGVERPRFSLRPDGDVWIVDHAGRSFRIKDSKGLRFLARLVAEPGRELHALDLAAPETDDDAAIDLGDAGAAIDDQARAAYRARIDSLRATLAEAEAWNDTGRAEAARTELDQLTRELSRAVGLGGRDRRTGAAAERARVNVTRRLRDAIRKIGEHDEPLARHLDRAVRTGTFCAYDPA